MDLKKIDVDELIATMVDEIETMRIEKEWREIKVIGIKAGGVWIANRICELLKHKDRPGELNIAYYRDDFNRNGLHPKVEPSELDFYVENQHVILIDDIISTGRTVRAAMNEIFDFGRPESITLACLLDRGKRELPINPDILGIKIFLPDNKHIKLIGPAPLRLELFDSKR